MSKPCLSRVSHLSCVFLASLLATFTASASTSIVVSVADQKLALVRDGEKISEYKISTSKFGVGDRMGSYSTPLGKLEVADRIGAGLSVGAVLKGRHATGEVLPVNAQGRDPIVTRILHLRGLEPCNENAFQRGIYIHGTPVERLIGKPESWGCIRMRSKDVIALFDAVPVGTPVEIMDEPIRRLLPGMLLATRLPASPVIAEAPIGKLSKHQIETLAPQLVAGTHPTKQVTTATAPVHLKAVASITSAPAPHHTSTAVSDLPSLGGIGNLHASQPHETGEHHSGMGLSLSLW